MSTATPDNIPSRKQHHLDACMNQPVEGAGSTFFEDVMFVHRAMPELDYSEIDTSVEFFEKKISLPLFISCMTGGSDQGRHANRELAKAAQELNIPIGLGSIRVLFNNPERIEDFKLRKIAPDVPIIANIGGAQIVNLSMHEIREWLSRLEVDGLAIHLNCGQELFQKGGDTRFRGIMDAIEKTIDNLSLPVIVKETGFGISPKEVSGLVAMGARYVDLAGAGGTNWVTVEQYANQTEDFAGSAFADWGTPTAILLDAVKKHRGKILGSGGLRSGMDLAKSIALGAQAGGMALPFIQAAIDGGKDEAVVLGRTIEKVLKSTMLLTGSRTIEDLQQQPLVRSLEFEHFVKSLNRIDS